MTLRSHNLVSTFTTEQSLQRQQDTGVHIMALLDLSKDGKLAAPDMMNTLTDAMQIPENQVWNSLTGLMLEGQVGYTVGTGSNGQRRSLLAVRSLKQD